MPEGFEVLTENSTTTIPPGNPTSFVCNLRKKGQAGVAVTIEYACGAETEAAWNAKTASRTKNVVSRTSTEVLVRQEHEVTGFAGSFDASEKLFIRVDARTIATIYAMSDMVGGTHLRFGAEDAASYARGRATANAPFSSNWKCPEGDLPPPTSTGTSPPAPTPTNTPGPGTTAAPAPGDKKPKKEKEKDREKDSESAPFLGLSYPVLGGIVGAVVLAGVGLTWALRRPRRIRVEPR